MRGAAKPAICRITGVKYITVLMPQSCCSACSVAPTLSCARAQRMQEQLQPLHTWLSPLLRYFVLHRRSDGTVLRRRVQDRNRLVESPMPPLQCKLNSNVCLHLRQAGCCCCSEACTCMEAAAALLVGTAVVSLMLTRVHRLPAM